MMSNNAFNFSGENAVLFANHERSLTIVDTFVSKGHLIFSLDGGEIASKAELLRNLAWVMKFPDYFGNNWDALEECLCDLDWLPAKGYVIRFANADKFIKLFPSDFRALIEIVESVSNYWSSHKVDFVMIVETNNSAIAFDVS